MPTVRSKVGAVHQELRRLVLSGSCEQLVIKIGCALTYVAPCLEEGQYHNCQAAISNQQLSHIGIKYPTFPFGNDETKCFQETAYLVLSCLEMLTSWLRAATMLSKAFTRTAL